MSEECTLIILTLIPISILATIITAENIQVSRYYVKISNFFSPNCGYKRFKKTKILTITYWKELVNYMIKSVKYRRSYLKKYAYFEPSEIKSFNNYDISLMDGVDIVLLKTKNESGNGFFRKTIVHIKKTPFSGFYVNYRIKDEDNKLHIYTHQPQFDSILLINIFRDTAYWKPIFNEKYKNWTEFDKLFKARIYDTDD